MNFSCRFILHETSCAHLVQLFSCCYTPLKEGWEHLDGKVKAKGNLIFASSHELQEIQMQLEMDEVEIVNHLLEIDASVNHFEGDFRFPIECNQEEVYKPFWQNMAASFSLDECYAAFNDWAILSKRSHITLDPQNDPDIHLTGIIYHADVEFPVEVVGKGSLHEDQTFWLEAEIQLDGREEVFLSLCSPEKGMYFVQTDIQNIPFHYWSHFQPSDNPITFSEGTVSAQINAWMKQGEWQKVSVENLLGQDSSGIQVI